MPDRYLAYIRQSLTADREDSLSLDFQERAIRDLVARQGGTLIEPPVIDADEKGWDPIRPGITALVERAERERPDAVAVYAVSRFARDNWLQEGIWRRLKTACPGVRFVSVTEPHAEDDLVRGILGVISEADRKRMGAFLSASFRERARRGLPHGRVPFGFVKGDDGRLVVDEEAARWVRQMVDHLEAGWSLWKVAVWLNDHNVDGRLWEPNVVRNTVTTPAIAGGVKTADVLTWDAHPPIIDRERHARLVAFLKERRPVRRGKAVSSWMEGLIRCGCGAPMHLIADRFHYDPPRGQFRCGAQSNAKRFTNLSPPLCRFRPRTIMQHRAEPAAIAALQRDLASLLDPADVYRALAAMDAQHHDDRAKQRDRLARQLAKANAERDRLLLLYQRGSLDVDRWEQADAAAAVRIAELTAELAAIPQAPDPGTLAHGFTELTALRDVVDEIAAADPAAFRPVLMAIGATVQRTADGVRIVWPSDLAALIGQ